MVDKKGELVCHRGHKVGDSWDFDTERGALCPMAAHVAFPFIDILRYGGSFSGQAGDSVCICCPDAQVINIFKIEKVTEG